MQRPPGFGWLRVRSKIILPYLLIALLLTLAMAFVAVRLTAGALQERIDNRLIEAGQATSDALVVIEEQHLAQLRAMVFTEGVADAFSSSDPAQLSALLAPHWVNANLSFLVAFDQNGQVLLSWQRDASAARNSAPTPVDLPDAPSWWIVEQIRAGRTDALGDKFSSLEAQHLLTAAPVRRAGQPLGGLIVGMPLQQLVTQLQTRSWASVTTFYNSAGEAVITTQSQANSAAAPPMPGDVLAQLQPTQLSAPPSHVQSVVQLNGREYQFAYSPLQIRRATDGYFSVGLSRQFIIDAWGDARLPLLIFSITMLIAIVGVGVLIARHITRPLHDLVSVAAAVTRGQLDQRVTLTSRDELGVVGHSFNQMTERLVHLYETSRALSTHSRIATILTQTEVALQRLVPEAVVVALLEDHDGTRWYTSESAPTWLKPVNHQLVRDGGALLEQTNDSHTLRSVPTDTLRQFLRVPDRFTASCVADLRVQGQRIGVLVVLHHNPNAFDAAVVDPIASVANMAATALHNTRLYLEVQQEGQRRRVILESIADGVVVCDAARNVILMNDAAEALLDVHDWAERTYQFGELPLKPVEESHLLSADSDLPSRYEAHGRILGASSATLASTDHGLAGEVIVLHNISDEVALDRAKTELIGMISHELRTPLTSIQGAVDLLAKGIGGTLNPLQTELAETARRQSRAMSALIDKAVLVTNIETGALAPHVQPTRLSDLVTMTIAPFEASTSIEQISLSLPDELPLVLVDAQMIKAALHEIIDNAIKYGDGSPVEIEAQPTAQGVELIVRDYGRGIPADELPHLFKQLSRNTDSSNARQRGLGLGLVIARGLIERHGGTISVQSRLGEGSLFTVSLPGVDNARRSAA